MILNNITTLFFILESKILLLLASLKDGIRESYAFSFFAKHKSITSRKNDAGFI